MDFSCIVQAIFICSESSTAREREKKTFHHRLRGATGVSKSKALKISPAKYFSIVFHSSRPFGGYHLHEFDTATAGVKLSITSVSGAITGNFKTWTNETDTVTSLTRANVNQAAAGTT
jgi:hypothetical protein